MILSNKKYITVAFSALTLLNEHQEEHQAQFFLEQMKENVGKLTRVHLVNSH